MKIQRVRNMKIFNWLIMYKEPISKDKREIVI